MAIRRSPRWRRILIAWSQESLGVPRSPNRNCEELRVLRQIDVSWHQVELYGLSDIRSGFSLGFAGRSAAGELRTDGRVIAGFGSCSTTTLNVISTGMVRARNHYVRRGSYAGRHTAVIGTAGACHSESGPRRVARHSHGTDRRYLAERRENPLLDAVLRSKSLCA